MNQEQDTHAQDSATPELMFVSASTSDESQDSTLFLINRRNVKKAEPVRDIPEKPQALLIAMSIIAIGIITGVSILYFKQSNNHLVIGVVGGIITSALILWLLPKWQIAWIRFDKANDRFVAENEARKTVAQVLGGLVFLIGFYFTAENLRSTQEAGDQTRELTRLGQLNERFARALEQLVKKDSVESPILGSYSLGQIALEYPERSKEVAEALTAYIRINSHWTDTKTHSPLNNRSDEPLSPGVQSALFQLREISRRGALSDDPKKAAIYKEALSNLDLSGTDLRGSDLTSMWLEGIDLTDAHLNNARLDNANLSQAILIRADLSGVDLSNTNLSGNTLLNGANLHKVSFSEKTHLTQIQIDAACFDEDDTLPPELGLKLPEQRSSECELWKPESATKRKRRSK